MEQKCKSVKGKFAYRCSNLFSLLAFFTGKFLLEKNEHKMQKKKDYKND